MKVLIADKIADKAIELLKQKYEVTVNDGMSEDELVGTLAGYDAVIVRSKTKVTARCLQNPGNLKVIGRAGTGVDNVDIAAATAKNIYVMNTPSANSLSVAELTIGHMLCFARKISYADGSMKQGKWEKKALKGSELSGKTLGLVGLGRIGSIVAGIANAFGMRTLVYDPYISESVAESAHAKLVKLEELLKESDFISIHVPLTDSTRGMVGKEEFSIMKKDAVIVNCARGGIVDEAELFLSLSQGKIGGACLDVFESEPPVGSPLLGLPNVVLTPHIGASTKEAQDRAGIELAEQITAALEEKRYINILNMRGV